MKQALLKGSKSDEWYTPEWCVSQIFEYYKPTGEQSKAAAHHSIYLGLNFDETKIEVE